MAENNEELLKNIWNQLTSDNQTTSDFETWKSNFSGSEEIQGNIYNYLKENNFTESDFKTWSTNVGLKKKENLEEEISSGVEEVTESVQTDGYSDSLEVDEVVEEGVINESELNFEDQSGVKIPKKTSINEVEVENKVFNEFTDNIETIETQANDPFSYSINTVTQELISGSEEQAVPLLKYHFNQYGFDFEETGMTGDRMNVTSANGEKLSIDLDNFLSSNDLEESAALKSFLEKNKSESRRLYALENKYSSLERKITQDKDIDTSVNLLNTQANVFNKKVQGWVQDKRKLDQAAATFSGLTQAELNQPEVREAYINFQNAKAKNDSERGSIIERDNDLKTQGHILDQTMGRYSEMQAERGQFSGATINGIWAGVGRKLAGAGSLLTDAYINYDEFGGAGVGAFNRIVQDVALKMYGAKKDLEGEPPSRKGGEAYKFYAEEYKKQNPDSTKKERKAYAVEMIAKESEKSEYNYKNYLLNSGLTEDQKKEVKAKAKDVLAKQSKFDIYNLNEDGGYDLKKIPGGGRYSTEARARNISELSEGSTIETLRTAPIEVFGSSSTTTEYSDLMKEGFWGGSYLGLMESIPAMLGGPGAAGFAQRTASMFTQVSDHVNEEMFKDPDFANISENEKLSVAVPLGIIVGALESVGFRNVVKQKGLLNKVLLKSIGKYKGLRQVQKRGFQDVVRQEVDNMLARGLLTVAAGGVAEFETGAAQEIADIGIKALYNFNKEADMFQTPDSIEDGLKQVLKAGAQEAVGGWMMSVPGAMSNAAASKDFTRLDNGVFEVFEDMVGDGSSSPVFKLIEVDLKNKVNKGEITVKEAKEQQDTFNELQGVYNKIPSDYSTKQKKLALGLLLSKQELEQRIAGRDPSSVKSIQDKIDGINSSLEKIGRDALAATENPNKGRVEDEEDAIQEQEEYSPQVFGDNPLSSIEVSEDYNDIGKQRRDKLKVITNLELDNEITSEESLALREESFRNMKEAGKAYEALTKTEKDALQKQSTESVDAQESSTGSETMGQGVSNEQSTNESNTKSEETTSETQAQEEIDKEEASDFEVLVNPDSKIESDIDNLPGKKQTVSNDKGVDIDLEVNEEGPNLSFTKKGKTEQENKFSNQILKQAKTAAKAISKIFPSIKIVIHRDNEQYRKIDADNDNGMYQPKDNTIHINLSKANGRTVAHEIFHAVLLNKLKMNDKAARAVTKKMVQALTRSKTLDKATRTELKKFIKNYDSEIQNEEKLSEIVGMIADNYTSLDVSSKSVVRKWVEKIAAGLGIEIGQSEADVVDLLNVIARKTISGQEITESDIESIEDLQTELIINGSLEMSEGGVSGIIDASSRKQASLLTSFTLQRFPTNPNIILEENTPLSRFNGKKSNLLESDRMTGAFIADAENNPVFKFFGGIYFPQITGKWWASRTISKANGIAKNMNANRDKDGYIYATPIIMKPNSHMSNQDMFETVWEFMKFDLRSKSSKVTKGLFHQYLTKALSLNSVDLTKQDLKINKSDSIEVMISKLNSVLIGTDSGLSFEKRKAIIKGILGDPKINEDRKFPTAGSISEVAAKFEEQRTKQATKLWDVVMLIRTKGELSTQITPKSDEFYHRSYPAEISSDQEIEVFFLDGAYNIDTTYPNLTKSSGGDFSWKEYSERHPSAAMALSQYGRTAKLSKASGNIVAETQSSEQASPEVRKQKISELESNLEKKYNATIDLYENKGLLELDKIIITENQRNKGIGSSVMKEIIDFANTKGLTIALTPSTSYGATSINRLKGFYKGLGFVENKGINKDFTTKQSMLKFPDVKVRKQKTSTSIPVDLDQQIDDLTTMIKAESVLEFKKDNAGKEAYTKKFFEKYDILKDELETLKLLKKGLVPIYNQRIDLAEKLNSLNKPFLKEVGNVFYSRKSNVKRGAKIKDDKDLGGIYKVEADGYLFRGISSDDFNRIADTGLISTDLRGTISEKEGINLADDAETAFNYLPEGVEGVVLAIKITDDLDLFMIGADDYVRSTKPIPYKNAKVVTSPSIEGRYSKIIDNETFKLQGYSINKDSNTDQSVLKFPDTELNTPEIRKQKLSEEIKLGKLINPARLSVAGIDISDLLYVASFGKDRIVNQKIRSIESDIKFSKSLSTTSNIETTRLRDRLIKGIDATLSVFAKEEKISKSKLIKGDGSINTRATDKVKDLASRIDILNDLKSTISENLFSPGDLELKTTQTESPEVRKQKADDAKKLGLLYKMNIKGFMPNTIPLGPLQQSARKLGLRVERALFKEGYQKGQVAGYYFSNGITQNGKPRFYNPRAGVRKQQSMGEIGRSETEAIDIIRLGRENNIKDDTIVDYLKRNLSILMKDIKPLMKISNFALRNVPKVFGNIQGGMMSGIKVFNKVYEFRKNLLDNNLTATGKKIVKLNQEIDDKKSKIPQGDLFDAKKSEKIEAEIKKIENQISKIQTKARTENKKFYKFTQEEIDNATLDFLQSQPEYKAASNKGAYSTLQAQMTSEMMNAFEGGVMRGDAAARIKLARKLIQRKGKSDLQETQRDLRNFIRKSLPSFIFQKEDVVKLMRQITAATPKNIENLKEEVLEFVNTKTNTELTEKINEILGGKYQDTQSGRKKGYKVSNEVRLRLESIKKLLTDINSKTNVVVLETRGQELENKISAIEKLDSIEMSKMTADYSDLQIALNFVNAQLSLDISIEKTEGLQFVITNLTELVKDGKSELEADLRAKHLQYIDNFQRAYYEITGKKIEMYIPNPEFNNLQVESKSNPILISNPESKQALLDYTALSKAKKEGVINRAKVKFSELTEGMVSFVIGNNDLLNLMSKIGKMPGELFGGDLQEMVTFKIDESTNEFKARKMATTIIINEKVEEVYGRKWREKSQKDSIPASTGIVMSSGVKIEDLSQNQMAYLVNQYKDPSNQASYEKKYGKDYQRIMKEMEALLNDEVKELMRWQVEEFFPSLYDGYNEVYKKVYRTSMPWNEHYAGRIYREGVEDDSVDVLSNGKGSYKGFASPASTKSRIKNDKPIKSMDQMAAMMTYVNDMNYFAAYSENLNDVANIFGNQNIIDAIVNNYGKGPMKSIDTMIETLSKRGVSKEYGMDWINNVTSAFVIGRLAINPTIFIKQLTSAPAYAVRIGFRNWMKYGTMGIPDMKANWKEITDNSIYIQDRYGESILRTLETYAPSKIQSLVPSETKDNIINALMYLVKQGDKGAIVIGGVPNYAFYKDQYRKKNPVATDQEVIDYAVKMFERDTKSSQQSSDTQDKDQYQTGGAINRSLNMFLTSVKQYLRKEMTTTRNLYRKISSGGKEGKGTYWENVKTLAMYHSILPVIFQYISAGLPGVLAPWEDEDEETLLRAAALGNLNGLFIIGSFVEAYGDYLTAKPWTGQDISAVPILTIGLKFFKELNDANQYNVTPFDKNGKQRTEESINKSIAGKQNAIKKAFFNLSNAGLPLKQVERLIKNADLITSGKAKGNELILRILQFSDYQVTSKEQRDAARKKKTKPRQKNLTNKELERYNPEAYEIKMQIQDEFRNSEMYRQQQEIKRQQKERREQMLDEMYN